ncbi:TolC family protein [uncultured Odoribacter sp.]|mgnify:CR=1 FL=1|uniref:TolC family protein n=1 Tax=uncultured Odoribacter sp. TaxID=876416 RepID=UPI002613C643|nr:TolC family protein [uncultured Odoribacter sp.]
MRTLLTVFLLLQVCFLQAQVELDLQKCRSMALENSKKMAIAGQQAVKANYDKKVYRANFFPKISAMGMYAYMQKEYSFKIDGGYLPTFVPDASGQLKPNYLIHPATGKPVVGADGTPIFNQYAFMPDIALSLGLDNAYTVGGVLEQPLYMGGKVRSAFRMASIGADMAYLNVRYNRAEVITEADGAYWQYLKVKELVLSALKYKEVVGELVKNLTDAYQTGMAFRNDLLKAQVKFNEAELLLQKARHGETLAAMNLCRIIGVDLHSSLQIRDSLQDGLTLGILEGNPDITGRPEYNLLEKEIELKKKQVDLTRSDFLPQLGVSASYGYTDGIALNGESDGMSSFMAIVSLKVPVFHWSEGRNKIKSARSEQTISELKRADMIQLMQLETARARFNVEDAASRVEMTRKSLLQAEENLTVSKNRYEVGMENLTNYMEAQAQWQKAWSDWIDAKSELRLSETQYLKATGRLAE